MDEDHVAGERAEEQPPCPPAQPQGQGGEDGGEDGAAVQEQERHHVPDAREDGR
jgi:hypothetical protein